MNLTTADFESTRPATTAELADLALNWDTTRWEFRVEISDDPSPRVWVTERRRED